MLLKCIHSTRTEYLTIFQLLYPLSFTTRQRPLISLYVPKKTSIRHLVLRNRTGTLLQAGQSSLRMVKMYLLLTFNTQATSLLVDIAYLSSLQKCFYPVEATNQTQKRALSEPLLMAILIGGDDNLLERGIRYFSWQLSICGFLFLASPLGRHIS